MVLVKRTDLDFLLLGQVSSTRGQGKWQEEIFCFICCCSCSICFCFLPDLREERTWVIQIQVNECFESHSCSAGKVCGNHTGLRCFLKWSGLTCLTNSRKTLHSYNSSCPLGFIFPIVKFFLSFIILIVLKDYSCLVGSKTSVLSLMQLDLEPLIEISLGHYKNYMDRKKSQ